MNIFCKIVGHKDRIAKGGIQQLKHINRVIYHCVRGCKPMKYRRIVYVEY